MSEDKIANCTFCGKGSDESFLMIGGVDSFICDSCVELCRDMIGAKRNAEVNVLSISNAVERRATK